MERCGRRARQVSSIRSLETLAQSLCDFGMDEICERSAEARHFLHDAGGEVGIFFAWHEEHRLKTLLELAIDQGHLQLIFEIGDGAQPPNDGADSAVLDVVHQKAIERFDLDVRHVFDGELDHLHPFIQPEEGMFARIVRHGHDDLVEDPQASRDDVGMAVRDRIEGTRIDPDLHDARRSSAPKRKSESDVSPYRYCLIRFNGPKCGGVWRLLRCSRITMVPSRIIALPLSDGNTEPAPSIAYGGSRNTTSHAGPA